MRVWCCLPPVRSQESVKHHYRSSTLFSSAFLWLSKALLQTMVLLVLLFSSNASFSSILVSMWRLGPRAPAWPSQSTSRRPFALMCTRSTIKVSTWLMEAISGRGLCQKMCFLWECAACEGNAAQIFWLETGPEDHLDELSHFKYDHSWDAVRPQSHQGENACKHDGVLQGCGR